MDASETFGIRSSTELADIGFDCLQHVFTDFELDELTSVAETCTQFRDVANYIFVRNYSKQRIVIKCNGFRRAESWNIYNRKKNENMILTDLKTSLQTLRCFGQSITDLRFEFKTVTGDVNFNLLYTSAISYINQYCADALKWISVDPVNIGFDNLCSKAFANVETVVLFMGKMDIISLNRIFPKMESLNFQWYDSDYEHVTIAEQYTHLKHFEFNLNRFSTSAASFLQTTLQLNTQIRSLKISAPLLFYKNMEAITLSNVRDFKISDARTLARVPFRLKRLQNLTLTNVDGSHLKAFRKFIKLHHRSIEKITFESGSHNVFEDLENGFMTRSEWVQHLQSLKEINMESYVNFPIHCVQRYMENVETLRCFTFFCSSSEDQIRASCDNGWDVEYLESPTPIESAAVRFRLPFIKLTRNI